MASLKPERPQPKIHGARSDSGPPDITLTKEKSEDTVLERTDSPMMASVNDNNRVLPSPARAKSAPHPILASANRLFTPLTDSVPLLSSDTVPQPNQQEPDSQMATVKTESGVSKAIPSTTPATPTIESTTPEAVVKAEPQSDASAAPHVSQVSKEITWKGLRDVADSSDLPKLEAGVAAALNVLDQLRTPLQDFKQHEELQDWLSLVKNLRCKAQKAGRTVIAVAGGTGAGKSSLINAVLDEEKLLPTNGMRACTAVITEVSWNEDKDPQQAYRAEVEFVSSQDWEAELKLMYDELLDTNGQLIPSWRDKTTEAGIAYDKVEAVYAELTHNMIMKSNPKDLVQNQAVAGLLGTTKKFAYSNAQALYSNLTKVIDSKEKAGPNQKRIMALWPIIRVVKIFVRAKALSTGVVIVDLPGTADSNAARSTIASKYMAECTSVWVVARITRAVDDKEAKHLLGRSSRIQMKLDGAYSHLTFVATQTDGIDVQETIDAVDDDGRIQATYAREQQLITMIEDDQHGSRGLDKQLKDLNDEWDALESEVKTWRDLQKKHKKGFQVYAPATPSKRPSQPKRRRIARRQIDDDESGSDDESGKALLTQDEISAKLQELQAASESKAAEFDVVEKQIESTKAKLRSLEQQKADVASERVSLCIDKRNNYCSDAIRQDFAAGIREIDEEDDSADAENYDPSVQKRDYGEVARSLDVFCISSKAYQQLRKTTRSSKTNVEGFRNLKDTEIPRLQQHAMASARRGQIRSNKAYLNHFAQVLNSLTMWTDTNELSLQPGHTKSRTEDSSDYEVNFLKYQLGDLKKQVADLVLQTKTELQSIVRETLGQRSSTAISYASKELLKIVARWGMPEKTGGYGLACTTYRAICRRGGEKISSKKARNFNEDVLEPFLQKISSVWEQLFTRTIPAKLDKFHTVFMDKLRAFHTLISSRPEMQRGKVNSMRILASQIDNHGATMKDAVSTAKALIHEEQRLASRLFLPKIKAEMHKIYFQCAGQTGPGCFQRMRDLMMEHIKKHKSNIFKKAGQEVSKALEKSFQSTADDLLVDCKHIRRTLASDYKLVLTSAEVIEVNAVVRDHIREMLKSADAKFDEILANTEPMVVDPVVEPAVPATAPESLTEPVCDA